ncbi:MAG TPA: hypothetical protein VGH86_04915 [Phenylobacterium sp.]|jgi:hypothetical protein
MLQMNTVDAPVRMGRSTGADEPGRNLRRRWTVITILLASTFFLEAVFAGAMLSGSSWARGAHAATAMVLVASTFAAGLLGLFTLRRFQHGRRLGLTLLSLSAAAFVQAALGSLSAKGANLTWIHVPLGVALVTLSGLAALSARRLDGSR